MQNSVRSYRAFQIEGEMATYSDQHRNDGTHLKSAEFITNVEEVFAGRWISINEKYEWAETKKSVGFEKYEGKIKCILIALKYYF